MFSEGNTGYPWLQGRRGFSNKKQRAQTIKEKMKYFGNRGWIHKQRPHHSWRWDSERPHICGSLAQKPNHHPQHQPSRSGTQPRTGSFPTFVPDSYSGPTWGSQISSPKGSPQRPPASNQSTPAASPFSLSGFPTPLPALESAHHKWQWQTPCCSRLWINSLHLFSFGWLSFPAELRNLLIYSSLKRVERWTSEYMISAVLTAKSKCTACTKTPKNQRKRTNLYKNGRLTWTGTSWKKNSNGPQTFFKKVLQPH